MKDPNNDKVDELLNELEMLKDELDHTELEQQTLRSIAKGLERDIKKVEGQLENLGVEC
jgi:chromosome segregation ATPase